MTTKSKHIEPERVSFRCDCGHGAFVNFEWGEDGELWIQVVEEPHDLWSWIKQWWHWKVYYSEIMLWKKDIKKLRGFLNEPKIV